MGKKKGTNKTPETTEETTPEETVEAAPAEEETPEVAEENTAQEEQDDKLAKTTSNLPALAQTIDSTDLFVERYLKRIKAVEKDLPGKTTMRDILGALPDEHQEAIAAIMRRMSSEKKGVYSADDRPDYTELRLYQGTGADPNRPDSAVPGTFYLTSKENVGKVFEGTVIAIWQGRTMWPDRDSGSSSRMPVCVSMDRKLGARFGACKDCPNLPFRDGKSTQCSDDVVAFMLTKDLQDIVIVRFSRTSEPAGRQLMRFVKKGMVPWEKWYRITADEHKNKESGFRWFTLEVNILENEDGKVDYVDDSLYDFCEAMCTNAEASFILPGLGRIYSQAEEARRDAEDEDDGPPVMKPGETPDYDDIDDAPNV
jgi:hypothetical protein